MSDPLLDELPILRELGDDLKAALRSRERAAGVRGLRRRARSRWLLAAGGFATAALGIALAFVVGLQGGGPSPSAATAALLRAAAAAEANPVPFPRDDQFYYVRSITTDLQVIRPNSTRPLRLSVGAFPKALVSIGQQLWFSADRIGVIKAHVISVRFPTAADHRLWVRLGRPRSPQALGSMGIGPLGQGQYLLGNIELTRKNLLAAPTNPLILYARLYAAGRSPVEVFTEIGDTLRNRPAPTAVRAALYRALALVPGIRLVGRATDSIGRPGTAVGFVHDGVEDELIFDPTSSEMLAERTIALSGGATRLGVRVGTLVSDTTYLQRAVTDTRPAP